MSSNFGRLRWRSNTIAIWLVLVSLAVLLALFFSWWLQAFSNQDASSATAGASASENPPVNELKLLAVEVVSRGDIVGSGESDLHDEPSYIVRPTFNATSNQPNAIPGVTLDPDDVNEVFPDTATSTVSDAMIGDANSDDDVQQANLKKPIKQENTEEVNPKNIQATAGSALAPPADIKQIRSLMDEALGVEAVDNREIASVIARREALASVERRSRELKFEAGSKVVTESMMSVFVDILAILSKYEDTQIKVSVVTNESEVLAENTLLSQERGRALIAKAVSLGIDFSRFSLEVSGDEPIPGLYHDVRIQAFTAQVVTNQ